MNHLHGPALFFETPMDQKSGGTRDVDNNKLAVIGFGSLIWCQGSLRIRSRWHKDGPLLPVEFARVSNDKRLTLVITDSGSLQRTLWAISDYRRLNQAKTNLKDREQIKNSGYIGAWNRSSDAAANSIVRRISEWAKLRNVRGVVWTALPPKDSSGAERVMPPEEALAYLSSLRGRTRDTAEEYIRNTPSQINTEIRKLARKRLGWTNHRLSNSLFEA